MKDERRCKGGLLPSGWYLAKLETLKLRKESKGKVDIDFIFVLQGNSKYDGFTIEDRARMPEGSKGHYYDCKLGKITNVLQGKHGKFWIPFNVMELWGKECKVYIGLCKEKSRIVEYQVIPETFNLKSSSEASK